MKRKLNILLVVAAIAAICIVGESLYWDNRASNTEARSWILAGVLHDDMTANLKRIDEGLPVREDTVLIKGLDDMKATVKSQYNKSLLHKWFGWEIF